jgi:hypothetical protein
MCGSAFSPAHAAGKAIKRSLTPDIPAPPPPPQAGKEPGMERRRRIAAGGGSILTGPSGVANSALNLGGNSILGG